MATEGDRMSEPETETEAIELSDHGLVRDLVNVLALCMRRDIPAAKAPRVLGGLIGAVLRVLYGALDEPTREAMAEEVRDGIADYTGFADKLTRRGMH
jgi:hypothetical protein